MTLRVLLVLVLVLAASAAEAQDAVTEATEAPVESTESTEADAGSDELGSFEQSADEGFGDTGGFAPTAEKKTVVWSGFLEPEGRMLVGEPHGKWIDSAKPDARLELKVYPTDQVDGAVVGELDLGYANQPTPSVKGDLRETWVRFYKGPFSASLGKQIFTWGSILEFGVTDILNPQELPDLSQDAKDRKIGVWSAKATWDFGIGQVDVHAIPWALPHDLPMSGPFLQGDRLRPLQRAAEADAKAAFLALQSAGTPLLKRQQELTTEQRQIEKARGDIDEQAASLDGQIDAKGQAAAAAGTDALKAQAYAELAALERSRAALETERVALSSREVSVRAETATVSQAVAAHNAKLENFRSGYEGALARPAQKLPPRDLRGAEGAVRLYFPLDLGDFSLGVARIHDRVGTVRFTPAAVAGTPSLVMEYPKLTAWTLTGAIPISSFAVRFEGLYLHTADPQGDQPLLRNPTLQSAAQVQWDPNSNWQVRVGIQDEQIFKLDDDAERADEYSLPSPAGSVLLLIAPRVTHTAVTYRFGDAMHQLQAAYLVSYETNGHFLNPEADFGIVEGVRLKAGAQIFLGDDDKAGFGQLDDLDNVYASLRVGF